MSKSRVDQLIGEDGDFAQPTGQNHQPPTPPSGTEPPATFNNGRNRKLTLEQENEILALVAEGEMTRKDIYAKFDLKWTSSITRLINRRTSEAEAQIAAQQALPDGPSSGGRIPVSNYNHSPSLSEMRTEGTAINLRILQTALYFWRGCFA